MGTNQAPPQPSTQFAYEGGGSWLYLLFCLLSGTRSDSLVKRRADGKKKNCMMGAKAKCMRKDYWERNEPKKKVLEK
jgi:hypothetical protein